MPRTEAETIEANRQSTQVLHESPFMVIVMLVFSFFAFPLLIALVRAVAGVFLSGLDITQVPLITPVLSQLLLAGIAIWRLRENGINWRAMILGPRRPAEAIFYGILLGIGLIFAQQIIAQFISVVAVWLEHWLGIDLIGIALEEQFRAFEGYGAGESPLLLAYFLLNVAVLAPISEELFFRGYAYTTFRSHWGARLAALATALIFAAVHFYFVLFLTVFVMGVLFAMAYERNRSLLSMMTAHCVVNLAATLFAYLAQWSPEVIA